MIDYGTATTYDVVGADGTFEAAVIAPGIRTSAQSMWNQAAMLPAVEIKKPEFNSSKRDHFMYAGRNCIWTDRADRIYHQEDKRRVWIWMQKLLQPADLAR